MSVAMTRSFKIAVKRYKFKAGLKIHYVVHIRIHNTDELQQKGL